MLFWLALSAGDIGNLYLAAARLRLRGSIWLQYWVIASTIVSALAVSLLILTATDAPHDFWAFLPTFVIVWTMIALITASSIRPHWSTILAMRKQDAANQRRLHELIDQVATA